MMTNEEIKANVPKGEYCCTKKETCPFFELVKLSKDEWKGYLATYDVPKGTKLAQYCNLNEAFLSMPNKRKDCDINICDPKGEDE